ncbi:MAG TPA: glycosyltransferase family 39 protein [Bacteroidales bacterium]|nr:glycosyltransferase family 39 protein [Bacteroidales bacterium]
MIFDKTKISTTVQIILLLILIYLVVFVKLGAFHMRLWDESMFAVNTYEMIHNGNYFANYFDGHPDICNTKPVLTLWAQIVCVKLFGYNELALRLPSALAAAMTVLLVFIFLYRNYSTYWAWAAVLILLTSQGFIGFHTARTAEADSLLTFFLLLSNLSFLKFIDTQKQKYVLFFMLSLTLAFATKMVAALLFLPSILIILIMYRQVKNFVLNPYFFAGILFFLLLNISFMILRHHENPDYFNDFFSRDVGRVLQVTDGFSGDFNYYLDNLLNRRFTTWFALLMIGFVMTCIIRKAKERKLMIMISVLAAGYLIIISAAATKVEWYEMPLYPNLAIIAASPVFLLLQWFSDSQKSHKDLKSIIIILVIFSFPYYMMFRSSQANSLNAYEKMNEASERFLFKKSQENMDLDGIKVYHAGYHGSLLFYKYKLQESGQHINLVRTPDFNLFDKVLVSNDSLKDIVKSRYRYRIIDTYDNAELIEINNKADSIKNQE